MENMEDKKYYIEYCFINDYGDEKIDTLGKTLGFTVEEAVQMAVDLRLTEVCTVIWTEIKELK